MIPTAFVTAWSIRAPWPSPAQVEQDLLLSRVLIEMYQDDFLRTTSSGIAPLTTAVTSLGQRLGFDVSTRISQHPKIYLRTTAADGSTLRIKIEINTHERSPARPVISMTHVVDSPWWSGQGDIIMFTPAELVSTKIRALFQRNKGRDLFDLWLALTELNLDPDDILEAYPTYAPPGLTAKRAIADLESKVLNPSFQTDIAPLIDPWPADYDIDSAARMVIDLLLSRIPRS